MIAMAYDLQKEKLDAIKRQRPEDAQYSEDLKIVYEEVETEESQAALERRTAAEERVRQVLYASGERITHGDLLTFQKLGQARALRAGGVRAVDRLSELRIHLKRSVIVFIFQCFF